MYLKQINDLRRQIATLQPEPLALRTGALWTPRDKAGGEFRLALCGQTVILTFPEMHGFRESDHRPLSEAETLILLNYFATSDGSPPARRWVVFPATAENTLAEEHFQQRTGGVLQAIFGNQIEAFQQAAERAGGWREFFGGLAYGFQALPRLLMLVACWPGGEVVPTTYRLLFDAAVNRHLSTESCALLGEQLTQRLLAFHQPGL